MISVSRAIQYIESHCTPLTMVSKPIQHCLGFVLAEEVISPMNMPPFKQSSMDGYAFMYSENNTYSVVDEIQAGHSKNSILNKGEAVRIFTGARVPDNANTVVMQEHTKRSGNTLDIVTKPQPFTNIRPVGEQIGVGEVALKKGVVLHEAAIGFLAGLGITTVHVYAPPKVSILVTGNELQKPGILLTEGQVYDSNSITLQLALHRLGIQTIQIEYIEDCLEATQQTISKHLETSDVVLISGGISVGDYDFVKEALDYNGVNEVFYKVNQKPGKPLWFGYKNNTKVFALPGNPASSLSCFYMYVLPLVKAIMGFQNYHLPQQKATATTTINNVHGKTLFLKGFVHQNKATPLTGQASSMLKSFAVSNALLIVPNDVACIKEGEPVNYLQLP